MSNGNGEWMPLYIGDYLGDTMELDATQHGAYLLLLMYYWRNGPLPLDDAKLAQIGRTDIRVWKKTVGPVVRAFFHEREGRLHQKRADKELAKADSISAKRRAAADASWTNRRPSPHPNGEDANADANASGLHPVCTADADANGMLRAPASPLPVQKKEPPLGPPQKRGGRSRVDKPRFKAGIFQLIADEGSSVTDKTDEKVTAIDAWVGSQMSAVVSQANANIRDWLKALAALIAPSMSGEEINARIGALTPHLAAEFPPPAFCRASLTAVARQCRFFPNFAEACEALAPWWRNHRPLPPAIQQEPIRQRDEPTPEERQHVARVTAETLAALRSSVQPIEDRRRPDTRCLSREQLANAYHQAGVRPPRCAAAQPNA